jgi:hypothetical protein
MPEETNVSAEQLRNQNAGDNSEPASRPTVAAESNLATNPAGGAAAAPIGDLPGGGGGHPPSASSSASLLPMITRRSQRLGRVSR